MRDDVILNKAATVGRCLRRIREEYAGHEAALAVDSTRQDAIVLNLLRACEACIDLAMHLVRRQRLGLPQESRGAFALLGQAGVIDAELSGRMQAMVGFRNVAVRDSQALSMPIVRAILDGRLVDFERFVRVAIELAA